MTTDLDPCLSPPVPWVVAELRGQRVYARADEKGALQSEGGGVEIRYKPNDGRRYKARADNLKILGGNVLPEETCGPAGDVVKPDPKAAAAAGAGKAAIPEGAVIAYADGACSGNPGPAGLGVVLLDGKDRLEISEYLGEGTNNIAELTAIKVALELVKNRRLPVRVHTDSAYAIGVLSEGWKVKQNKELVASIQELMRDFPDLRLVKVRGHSGDPRNERVDQLARDAITRRA